MWSLHPLQGSQSYKTVVSQKFYKVPFKAAALCHGGKRNLLNENSNYKGLSASNENAVNFVASTITVEKESLFWRQKLNICLFCW